MRITDSRYDRDRQRLTVAYRLIGHEARTQTIRQATGLSGDRIRKLYRDYFTGQLARPVRRRRGKSPRQMLYRPNLDEVNRFCDVYETFCALCPGTVISFEHAWHLLHVLARLDEFVLARCPDCHGTWIRDTLDLLPDNCAGCRADPPD